MSKYSELVALLEYMEKKNSPRFGRKKKEIDLVSLLKKKKEEMVLLETFLKEQEDEKKKKSAPKGHSFTFAEGVILAFMAQFIVGPIYKAVLTSYGLN